MQRYNNNSTFQFHNDCTAWTQSTLFGNQCTQFQPPLPMPSTPPFFIGGGGNPFQQATGWASFQQPGPPQNLGHRPGPSNPWNYQPPPPRQPFYGSTSNLSRPSFLQNSRKQGVVAGHNRKNVSPPSTSKAAVINKDQQFDKPSCKSRKQIEPSGKDDESEPKTLYILQQRIPKMNIPTAEKTLECHSNKFKELFHDFLTLPDPTPLLCKLLFHLVKISSASKHVSSISNFIATQLEKKTKGKGRVLLHMKMRSFWLLGEIYKWQYDSCFLGVRSILKGGTLFKKFLVKSLSVWDIYQRELGTF